MAKKVSSTRGSGKAQKEKKIDPKLVQGEQSREDPRMAIEMERDRRMAHGFEFQGEWYQSRQKDRDAMAEFAVVALAAILNGAKRGDYRWFDEGEDFTWITANNKHVQMDAQTVVGLQKAAVSQRMDLTFAARELKAANVQPNEIKGHQRWQKPGKARG